MITDSRIYDIWLKSGEGKPLLLNNLRGAIIRNNAIIGGAIGILVGGAGTAWQGLLSGDIEIRNNLIEKPGKEMYREGAGAPTGACYSGGGSGQFYRNTSSSGTCSTSGRCYTCQPNNTWQIDTAAVYRDDDFLTKNLVEFKEADGIRMTGNILRGQQASVDTQSQCILMVAAVTPPFGMAIRNVTFADNWCADTFSSTSTTSYATGPGYPASENILVENNLATGLGSAKLVDRDGGTGSATVWQVRLPPWSNQIYRHNTYRHASDSDIQYGHGIRLETFPSVEPPFTRTSYVQDNIWWQARTGASTEGSAPADVCNLTTSGYGVLFLQDGTKQVRNNVQYANAQWAGPILGNLDTCAATQNLVAVAADSNVGFAADNSLQSTSPYSAACSSGCAFAATDGGDLGADIARLNTALSGVDSGVPSLSIRMALGSTRAIAHYTAPDTSACDVKLYTSQTARTAANLHGDTDSGGEQVDSRAGSVTAGAGRQLVLGVNTALTPSTPYALLVTCGASVALANFRTLAAGSGTYTVNVQLPAAATGEYSSSADMSSPTAISSSAAHAVPVPTGAVRYYRTTAGPIQALVAR